MNSRKWKISATKWEIIAKNIHRGSENCYPDG
jgi:hypothetical protein